jgi:hypothetical protein
MSININERRGMLGKMILAMHGSLISCSRALTQMSGDAEDIIIWWPDPHIHRETDRQTEMSYQLLMNSLFFFILGGYHNLFLNWML